MSETKVLFVCLGNICRSPMAEAIFRHTTLKLNANFTVDSCGTASYHVGSDPDKRAVDELKKHGIPIEHKARQIHHQDFRDFDYILCMDYYNLEDVKEIEPKDSKAKIKLFGEFDPEGVKVIGDPYYGQIDGFRENFDQITRCSKGFLKHLGHDL